MRLQQIYEAAESTRMADALKDDLVAVCSRSFSHNQLLCKELELRYANVKYNRSDKTLVGQELVTFLQGAAKTIIGLERVNKMLLSQLPDLHTISKFGVGLDKVDFSALSTYNINFGWTPGVNAVAVAELTIAQMLMMLRDIPASCNSTSDQRWKKIVGRQLSTMTVGIIGCGNIGVEVIKRLQPFGAKIMVNDIKSNLVLPDSVSQVELNVLLTESDIVTVHVPLDKSTKNLLDANTIAQMKQGAYLLNLARGGIVDEGAARLALQSGWLTAAAFDVLVVEPPVNNPLLQLPNFYCTPHIAGSTIESITAMGRAAIMGLDDFVEIQNVLV